MKKTLKIILFCILIFPYPILAQQTEIKLHIKVDNPSNEHSKIYLLEFQEKDLLRIIDSASVNSKGTYKFKVPYQEPKKVRMVWKPSSKAGQNTNAKEDYIDFYLEKNNINIRTQSSLAKSNIIAGEINHSYKDYNKQVVGVLNNKIEPIKLKYETLAKENKLVGSYVDSLRKDMEEYMALEDSLNLNFVQSNPNSIISLDIISSNLSHSNKNYINKKLLSYLDENLINSPKGQRINASLYNQGLYNIGSIAPDFQQEDINGNPVKLSDFKGKYVLIDFWASWCGPCRKENPNVLEAYNLYKNQNFTVLGVSLDNPGKKADWLKAIEDDHLPWTNVSDLKGWENAAAKLYGVRAIPHNVLVDPQGKIIAINLRGNNLNDFLKNLFKTI